MVIISQPTRNLYLNRRIGVEFESFSGLASRYLGGIGGDRIMVERTVDNPGRVVYHLRVDEGDQRFLEIADVDICKAPDGCVELEVRKFVYGTARDKAVDVVLREALGWLQWQTMQSLMDADPQKQESADEPEVHVQNITEPEGKNWNDYYDGKGRRYQVPCAYYSLMWPYIKQDLTPEEIQEKLQLKGHHRDLRTIKKYLRQGENDAFALMDPDEAEKILAKNV